MGSEYAEEQKNERLGLGLDYKGYIYRRGNFVIFEYRVFIWVGFRVGSQIFL